ncbi:STM4504/CBY_0614 family protein [uncultured Novosphingobium sp.]|uniref:STM4504/CBY_0614 family protein n=1 Tax=uncultured Novosphingobium sp. TaxID=292277 RepID=UPI00374A462B
MARFDLYGKRQADAAKLGQTDVYRYDILPEKFRNQFLNIAQEVFGEDNYYIRGEGHKPNRNWSWVHRTYGHEEGKYVANVSTDIASLMRDLFRKAAFKDAINLLEVIGFRINEIEAAIGGEFRLMGEVNYRLREAGVGFQFENGRRVRVDSQFLHSEIVKPALTLLSQRGFEGPQEEFLAAHASYRENNNKEAVSFAAKALESTFKAIFDAKGWEYNQGARISDLIKVGRANSLWPDYLHKSFEQLAATLHSGLPQIRDKDAAHGQGAVPREVPSYLAAYALHLAASKIVFIVSAAEL